MTRATTDPGGGVDLRISAGNLLAMLLAVVAIVVSIRTLRDVEKVERQLDDIEH